VGQAGITDVVTMVVAAPDRRAPTCAYEGGSCHSGVDPPIPLQDDGGGESRVVAGGGELGVYVLERCGANRWTPSGMHRFATTGTRGSSQAYSLLLAIISIS
jgi:hypothetical protein